jgi:hypothetical protein
MERVQASAGLSAGLSARLCRDRDEDLGASHNGYVATGIGRDCASCQGFPVASPAAIS